MPSRTGCAGGGGTRLHDDLPLDGSCVLVTGAARRLGAAISRRMHAAGATVAVHHRRSARGAAGRRAAAVPRRMRAAGATVAVHHRRSASEAAALVAEMNAARAGSAISVACDL